MAEMYRKCIIENCYDYEKTAKKCKNCSPKKILEQKKEMEQVTIREIEYQEGKNPFQWNCEIHGSGWGQIDECPHCMEEDMQISDEIGRQREMSCNICGKFYKTSDEENGLLGRYSLIAEEGCLDDWDRVDTLDDFCEDCKKKIVEFIKTIRKKDV